MSTARVYQPPLRSPNLTYTAGVLTSVSYEDGSTRTFTYDVQGRLSVVDTTRFGSTRRRTLTYALDGSLDFVTDTDL